MRAGVAGEQTLIVLPLFQLVYGLGQVGRETLFADEFAEVTGDLPIGVAEELRDNPLAKVGVDGALEPGDALKEGGGVAPLQQGIVFEFELLFGNLFSTDTTAGEHLDAQVGIVRMDVATSLGSLGERLVFGKGKHGCDWSSRFGRRLPVL